MKNLIHISTALAFLAGALSLIHYVAPKELSVYSNIRITPCVLEPEGALSLVRSLYRAEDLGTKVVYFDKLYVDLKSSKNEFLNLISKTGAIVRKQVTVCEDGPGYFYLEEDGDVLRLVMFENPGVWRGQKLRTDGFLPYQDEILRKLGCGEEGGESSCLRDRRRILRFQVGLTDQDHFVDFERKEGWLEISGPFTATKTGDVDAAIHTFLPINMASSSLYSEYHCTRLKLDAPWYLRLAPCEWPLITLLGG